jgi:formylglycine-generating enzyme required for sulfatase activity
MPSIPWLSRVVGKTYRLKTEAEREDAVRSGTTMRYALGESLLPCHAQSHASHGTGRVCRRQCLRTTVLKSVRRRGRARLREQDAGKESAQKS